jgi:hypothetical protein
MRFDRESKRQSFNGDTKSNKFVKSTKIKSKLCKNSVTTWTME